MPTAPLAVVTDSKVTAPSPGYAQANAGLVDPATTSVVEQVFRLKNTTAQPVTISRLRASCGCETLLLSKAGRSSAMTVLTPGEQADVKMTVKIAGQRTGVVNKFAWVYGPQGDPPLATLAMVVTIREAISFAPSFLDFGSVAVNTSQTLPLTVTADQSVVPASGLPPLVSARPDIRITPQGTPQPVLRDGKPSLKQNYLVTLVLPLQSGRLSGDVRFQSLPQTTGQLSSAFVPLGGTVTGEIAASPKSLFFGSVSRAQPVTRQVLISVAAKNAGGRLTVSTDTPWLLASLAAQEIPGTLPGQCLLQVTLKNGAPAGSFEAKIFVVSEKGERLTVPVVAEIRDTKAAVMGLAPAY